MTTPVDEMSDDVRITILLCISLIAVLTLLLAATSGPIPMGVVLGLGGLAVAPAVAAYTTLANSAVLADVRGEASIWLVTIPAATQALGLWIAGLLVAGFHGSQVAFVVAGAVTATSLVWLRRPRRAGVLRNPDLERGWC